MGADIIPLKTTRSKAPTPARVVTQAARLVANSLRKNDAPPGEFRELLEGAIEAAYGAKQAEDRLRREGTSDAVPGLRLELLSSLLELSVSALLALGHFPKMGDVDPAAWAQHLRQIRSEVDRPGSG
ncbi:MAG: hypothetical protein V3T33_00870 [Myxococcota bacterium]